MSNLSKLQALSSTLARGVAKEIEKRIEKTPGSWTHRSSSEGFLSHGAQSYAGVSDNTVARFGTSGNTIVDK